ncbi:MAG: hypothetical protein GF355_05160 [Candidatus Eisenbacteria bacterium]|nr:hypothetical protein [Candidatus Eisenbacteria bacterium]
MTKRQRGWFIGALLALSLAVMGTAAGDATAADKDLTDKLKLQINVMEKVFDEVLVDSPNLLVYSSNPTHGLYLDEFGVVFVFEASLVDKGMDWEKHMPSFLKNFTIESEDGKIIIYQGDDEDADEDSEGKEEKDLKESVRDLEEKKKRMDAELYAKGKEELIEALVDYGDTMTRLDDAQWVAIAAFLKNSDYFLTNRISQLLLKAKLEDLRAYSSEDISRDELISRVVVEEY